MVSLHGVTLMFYTLIVCFPRQSPHLARLLIPNRVLLRSLLQVPHPGSDLWMALFHRRPTSDRPLVQPPRQL